MSELLSLYVMHSDPVAKYQMTVTDEMPEGTQDPVTEALVEAGRLFGERMDQMEGRTSPRANSILEDVMNRIRMEYELETPVNIPDETVDVSDQVEEGGPIAVDGTYIRTLAAFSGADSIISVDGEMIGEIQGFHYTEQLSGGSLNGYLELARFDQESPLYAIARQTGPKTIRIRQANEYGQQQTREIVGVRFLTRVGGISMDGMFETERYNFDARSIQMMNE